MNLYVDSLGRDNYNIVKSSDENQDSEFKLELQAVALKSMQVCYLNEITHQEYKSNFQDVRLTGELSTDEFEMLTSGQILLNSAKKLRIDIGKESRNRLQFKTKCRSKKRSNEIANSSNSNWRTSV